MGAAIPSGSTALRAERRALAVAAAQQPIPLGIPTQEGALFGSLSWHSHARLKPVGLEHTSRFRHSLRLRSTIAENEGQ